MRAAHHNHSCGGSCGRSICGTIREQGLLPLGGLLRGRAALEQAAARACAHRPRSAQGHTGRSPRERAKILFNAPDTALTTPEEQALVGTGGAPHLARSPSSCGASAELRARVASRAEPQARDQDQRICVACEQRGRPARGPPTPVCMSQQQHNDLLILLLDVPLLAEAAPSQATQHAAQTPPQGAWGSAATYSQSQQQGTSSLLEQVGRPVPLPARCARSPAAATAPPDRPRSCARAEARRCSTLCPPT